ncbi:Rrf2 family transcriptional regulator [Lentzea sp. BCCO 10_0061]|uniref:Rrf2 family transcriptional regulator n=2 Tax=Lentzea sokolovensis TaxID=3095429 RepID=A0ABU4URA9_9PSEU|nr:Rrf2 family transcriptional regulator [Lentzea sp. BCCO 10_0061]MDX8142032.1 Rrf2 family transcriptional regulator [Lentzea sp. BCCO 10_0061]
MKQGVEWAVHVLLSVAWVGDDRPVSTAAPAASYDLPQTFLHHRLQALDRAGLVESLAAPDSRGRRTDEPEAHSPASRLMALSSGRARLRYATSWSTCDGSGG